MTDFWMFESPVGMIALAAQDGALVRLYLPNTPTPRLMPHKTPLMERAETQLMEYFRGERKAFDLPVAPEGTPFQKRVWQALEEIPYGQVCSYGDIARRIECPKGFRAVGMANNRNPLPILVPCHRVLGSKGQLVGYTGGPELKTYLLELEKKFDKS